MGTTLLALSLSGKLPVVRLSLFHTHFKQFLIYVLPKILSQALQYSKNINKMFAKEKYDVQF
jgi:hypothetical protein